MLPTVYSVPIMLDATRINHAARHAAQHGHATGACQDKVALAWVADAYATLYGTLPADWHTALPYVDGVTLATEDGLCWLAPAVRLGLELFAVRAGNSTYHYVRLV